MLSMHPDQSEALVPECRASSVAERSRPLQAPTIYPPIIRLIPRCTVQLGITCRYNLMYMRCTHNDAHVTTVFPVEIDRRFQKCDRNTPHSSLRNNRSYTAYRPIIVSRDVISHGSAMQGPDSPHFLGQG
jgi:hypothetical protein